MPMHLHVHVNYLNRAVKEVTGKSTTTHITERIVSEAKALLQHTAWNIADIAYALGFEYPTYFNNFFKRANWNKPENVTDYRKFEILNYWFDISLPAGAYIVRPLWYGIKSA